MEPIDQLYLIKVGIMLGQAFPEENIELNQIPDVTMFCRSRLGIELVRGSTFKEVYDLIKEALEK